MTLSLKRARREQKTNALRLLTLSGAIRAADIEARYRGSDMVLGAAARPNPERPRHQESIWWMDLTDLLKAFRAKRSASHPRRNILPSAASSHRDPTKRPVSPRAA